MNNNKIRFIDLENSLIGAIEKTDVNSFINCLKVYKSDYKMVLSSFYLRNLLRGNEKQNSNKVAYILKKSGLKTKSDFISSFERTTTPFKTDVINYAKNKEGKVFIKDIKPIVVGLEQNRRRIKTFNYILV